MTIAYNLSYPNPPNNPSADVPLMQENTNAINQIIGIDHIPFNTAPPTNGAGGYHTDIHMFPQSTPAKIMGIGQLYAQTIGSDQQLFYESGGGIITQLTGSTVPTPGANGFVYLAGGILLQWGTIAATAGNPSVNLATPPNIIFPTNLFNVQVTRQHAPSSPGSTFSYWVSTTGLSNSGFTIFNNDGHTWSYNWLAVGN